MINRLRVRYLTARLRLTVVQVLRTYSRNNLYSQLDNGTFSLRMTKAISVKYSAAQHPYISNSKRVECYKQQDYHVMLKYIRYTYTYTDQLT